ncbi:MULTISPECIES: ABC transporter permease [Mucilaginibacter]|jgi:putative ABC transport system permease protein|uniref:ABC transporter permease n=1 Tax=Mucilaginibacter TaxID=423349 RepID=UPI00087178BB|nr:MULTISPECIES: ABC transporter permease [Mucilaginibacter]SCW46022.1 putative ABC transport system permease protein [Mucilaginibacter sp. NFR10]
MIKNYFKIAWRNLWKHKFYTFINMFGLALSIGCSIILFQFITYHLSFDTYHHDAKQVYRVVHQLTFDDGMPLYDQGAPLALATDVKANNPQVKDVGVLLRMHDINVSIPQNDGAGKKMFAEHENISITDGHFFNLFDYGWEQGNQNTALTEPNTVVLSHYLAEKYFGSQEVIGKTIRVDNKNTFRVTGVVKDHPANTDIKADLFLSLATLKNIYPDVANGLQNDWGFINSTNSIYLELKDGANPQSVEKDINRLNVKLHGAEAAKPYHFMMLPLSEVHFDGRFAGVIQRSLLVTLGIIGLLLIIIACVNFINMATAQSFKRAKEIGTRKVLGSSPRAIFIQFISETSYIVVFAALLSFVMVITAIPVLNNWLQTQLSFKLFNDYRLAGFTVVVLVIIIIAAGSYPALILSRLKPVNALKNQLGGKTHAAGFTRKGLIVVQNIIAQVLIISTILITMQVKYLKTADLGFNKNAVVMIPVPDNDKSKTNYLRNQLLADPAIKSISFCYRAPSSTADKGGSIKFDTRDWEKFVGYTQIGDADYVKTFGMQLIAGRNIVEADTAREYLVNEVLIHKLGLKDPKQAIGRFFTAGDLSNNPGIIVGVVKDFHAKSLYTAIAPEYISTFRKGYQYAGVKIGSNNPSAVIDRIKKEWQEIYPDNVFEYRFLDQQIADFYQKEDLLNKLITSSAIIAIFISCLGLLGLISLLTLQRTKEIGIRKVLGASVTNITGLLSVDFLKLVLIAVIVASPIAWLMMSKYLQNFAYRIDIQWWVFVLAAFVALLIAFITVSFQSIKAAMANPVESLRSRD